MQINGTLKIVKRENNSINGNPRFLCQINNTLFYTKPDCMYGYKIQNYEGKPLTVKLKYYYNKLSLDKIEKV